jgi:HemY protein
MKLLGNVLFWIVLVLLGALAAQFLLTDPGYVLVRYRGTDYTTTAAAALAVMLAVLLGLVLAWKLVTLPFRAWRAHSDRRSRVRLGEGLDALHYGQYQRAEKLLAQAADEDESVAASARLAAARAALRRGDAATARAYLDAMGEQHAAARAIALAELALRAHRPTDALVALDAPAAQPLPPRGLALRAEALAATGHATEAYGMLGPLRKQGAFTAARLDELQERWAAASLREAPDTNALADRWQALPKNLKSEPVVVLAYADRAHDLGWDEAAIKAVEQALDVRWDERLAARYGSFAPEHAHARQAMLERWLRAQPSSPTLLLALARSHREQGRWAESRDYLQRALAQGAGAEAWEELGHGYTSAGDEARARIGYANALRAARGEPPFELPPDPGFETVPGIGFGTAAPMAVEERDEHGLPRLRG